MKKMLLPLLIAAFVAPLAHAEITPPRGQIDPRVRVVRYDPMNVIKLPTFYGVSTHIQFGSDEVIQDVAAGDDLAWKIAVSNNRNNMYVKPIKHRADTNLTVVTDKRSYNFVLTVTPLKGKRAWANSNLIYALRFDYPEFDGQSVAAQNKREIKRRLAQAGKRGSNYDYWVKGDESVSPTAAYDDGRFVYLTFANNRDMPSIFAVNESGDESLINTNVIDGNTIVIQRLVPGLMLRRGQSVAHVINKSFKWDAGSDNTTGTAASDVMRVVKGNAQ